eukprot:6187274-Pleurochrysis_carterae.AAC.4
MESTLRSQFLRSLWRRRARERRRNVSLLAFHRICSFCCPRLSTFPRARSLTHPPLLLPSPPRSPPRPSPRICLSSPDRASCNVFARSLSLTLFSLLRSGADALSAAVSMRGGSVRLARCSCACGERALPWSARSRSRTA